jgi:hypothetical protein
MTDLAHQFMTIAGRLPRGELSVQVDACSTVEEVIEATCNLMVALGYEQPCVQPYLDLADSLSRDRARL